MGADFFTSFAVDNDMDLLLGIDPNCISNSGLEDIYKRIEKYIRSGTAQKNKFTLYFNDIPADISPGKLKKIFSKVKGIRKNIENQV